MSPILANVYLHYSLDLWFIRVFQKSCYGQSRIIQYADDFVVCFQHEVDATQFRHELDERLAMFGLEAAPEKTKVIEFGPFVESSKDTWLQAGNLRFSRIYALLRSVKKRQAIQNEADNFA